MNRPEWNAVRVPIVEIFETIEGEGTKAGFPTVFVRLFGCNLRCVWCDTTYSYPPAEPGPTLTVAEIVERATSYRSRHLCLTGGEPLMYGERSRVLLEALAACRAFDDIHVETNGAVDLRPFLESVRSPVVRYIMDYKLPDSGEEHRMVAGNLPLLRPQDELKFVVASRRDFDRAVALLGEYDVRAQVLFSPVWGAVEPRKLVEWMLERGLARARLNLQLHKIIWSPDARGV